MPLPDESISYSVRWNLSREDGALSVTLYSPTLKQNSSRH